MAKDHYTPNFPNIYYILCHYSLSFSILIVCSQVYYLLSTIV